MVSNGFKMINIKRGQTSVEFLLLVGLVSLVLMASLTLLLNFARSSTDEIVINQIDTIGKKITDNAEMLSVYGYPARRVLDFSFPENLNNLTIAGGKTLYFNVALTERTTYMGFYSNANISANFSESDFTKGDKRFLLKVSECEDKVMIERW